MPKARPAQTSFNAGELSPLVGGRVDLERYSQGLALCENFLPLVQGGMRNRPGERFINSAKSHVVGDVTRLVPFVFSQDQSYMLEFGNLYFRVYRNRAAVISGTHVEVVTPWATADLALLQFVQSADVLYVTHPGYEPYVIGRSSHTSWSCTALTLNAGPFLDDDPGTTTMTPSGHAVGASITVTASAATFVATDVGALMRLWCVDVTSMLPWEAGKSYSAASYIYQNGRIYTTTAGGTSGTVPPTHEEGTRKDGVSGVDWAFVSGFYGIVRITGFTSSTVVDATVLMKLPDALAGHATTRWAMGAFSDTNGYPAAVSFYQDRLVFGGTEFQPDTVWMSGVGDYQNFNSFSVAGQATSDLSVTATVSSQQVNRIRWMTAEGAGLLCGTEANEFLIAPASAADGLSQSNIRALAQTSYGSAPITPVRAGAATLFIQRAGRQVREAVYDYSVDRYVAPDLTVLADHITKAGISGIAYAPEPHGIVWVWLNDGSLRALVYDRDQQVTAWSRHVLGGAGDASGSAPFVESIAVIASPDGTRSDAWVCARRWINGAAKRYIGVLVFDRDLDGDVEDSLFLDCSATYDGAATTSISGLSHLNGVSCHVIADGYVHPVRTPSGGSITLEKAASVVHVGLYAAARGKTMRIEAGAADGTAQARLKRFDRVTLRVYRSTGGRAGVQGGDVDRLLSRDSRSVMTGPVNLTDEDRAITFPGSYDLDGQVYFEQDVALPLNVLAIFPSVETTGR